MRLIVIDLLFYYHRLKSSPNDQIHTRYALSVRLYCTADRHTAHNTQYTKRIGIERVEAETETDFEQSRC